MDKLYRHRLKKFRLKQFSCTTQEELSETLAITQEYYSQVETGKNNPSIPLHVDLCLKLQKPSDCFFNENRTDWALKPEQIARLLEMPPEDLKILLTLLQSIYEEKKAVNKTSIPANSNSGGIEHGK